MNLEIAKEDDFLIRDPKYFTLFYMEREKSFINKSKNSIDEHDKYKNDYMWEYEMKNFIEVWLRANISNIYILLSILLFIPTFVYIGFCYILKYCFIRFKTYNQLIVLPFGWILYKLIYWQQDLLLISNHRTIPFTDIELKKVKSEIASYCWYNVWYLFYKSK